MAKKRKDPEHIRDLTPDPENARKHNPRNIGMIEQSLQEVGAARSIVIDEDGRVLAGNGTVEGAAQAGITKVMVVDADGETIVAVRRKGLTEEQKRRLALYDNRTTDLSTWDAEVLAMLDRDATVGMFTDEDLAGLTAAAANVAEDSEPGPGAGDMATITLRIPDEQAPALERELSKLQKKLFPALVVK